MYQSHAYNYTNIIHYNYSLFILDENLHNNLNLGK